MGGSRLATRATLKNTRTALMRPDELSRGVGLSWVRIPPPAPRYFGVYSTLFQPVRRKIRQSIRHRTECFKNRIRSVGSILGFSILLAAGYLAERDGKSKIGLGDLETASQGHTPPPHFFPEPLGGGGYIHETDAHGQS